MSKKQKAILRADDDIKALMLEADEAESQIDVLKTKADMARAQVKKNMLEEDVEQYVVDDKPEDPKFLVATVYTTKKITYDVEAIKAKLSREQRKLVTKNIMVAEEAGLKAFIKAHPELRAELAGFVSKVSMIDEHKLGLAIEYGNVTLEDIKGCYEVKENDIFKLQRVKRFELLE